MSFPVNSTSVCTSATKRAYTVLQRLDLPIKYGAVFACRKVANSSVWSDHAYGAACDFFPTDGGDHDTKRARIAHAIVYQSTHRTKANRFRKLRTRYVIDHNAQAIWLPALGWRPYSGSLGDHVHGSFGKAPSGTPACAR